MGKNKKARAVARENKKRGESIIFMNNLGFQDVCFNVQGKAGGYQQEPGLSAPHS